MRCLARIHVGSLGSIRAASTALKPKRSAKVVERPPEHTLIVEWVVREFATVQEGHSATELSIHNAAEAAVIGITRIGATISRLFRFL
tara:strand:- start:539 stop:802 length:264 start_codon:yes stop_codon:yes gene_type:complete